LVVDEWHGGLAADGSRAGARWRMVWGSVMAGWWRQSGAEQSRGAGKWHGGVWEESRSSIDEQHGGVPWRVGALAVVAVAGADGGGEGSRRAASRKGERRRGL